MTTTGPPMTTTREVTHGDLLGAGTCQGRDRRHPRPMWALRAHRRGGPEQLVYEQAPRPPLGIGDVLLQVQAASFTPTELGWPSTWTDRLGRDRIPVIPAHEVSGMVAALGYGTSGLSV